MKYIPLSKKLINGVINISKVAGNEIMSVYQSEFDIFIKDDHSPLTDADLKANAIIIEGLEKIAPSIPVLSEEGVNIPYEERSNWDMFWLVDSLDGTKEFIKKNNEFTVNIALLKNNHPIFGVVYAPALNKLYWGSSVNGSYKLNKDGIIKPISVKPTLNNPVQIAVSRSHPSSKMNGFTSLFSQYELHAMGSSLKICSVSDGTVHFYPRFGPTMEWDTAASHAIINAAGGELIKIGTNKPLKYNKKDLLNPEFIAGNIHILKKIFQGNKV